MAKRVVNTRETFTDSPSPEIFFRAGSIRGCITNHIIKANKIQEVEKSVYRKRGSLYIEMLCSF